MYRLPLPHPEFLMIMLVAPQWRLTTDDVSISQSECTSWLWAWGGRHSFPRGEFELRAARCRLTSRSFNLNLIQRKMTDCEVNVSPLSLRVKDWRAREGTILECLYFFGYTVQINESNSRYGVGSDSAVTQTTRWSTWMENDGSRNPRVWAECSLSGGLDSTTCC